MKKIMFITMLFAYSFAAKAQTITVVNHLACDFHCIGTAQAVVTCSGIYNVTMPIPIGPGATVVINMTDPTIWAGIGGPGAGGVWEWAQILDACIGGSGTRCYAQIGDNCGNSTTNSYTVCCGSCTGSIVNLTWTGTGGPTGPITIDIN